MIHARIQSHPSRAHLHQPLADSLGLPTEIVIHESDPPSPWDGYRLCLSNLPDSSHLVVLQDDATVCTNFAEAITEVARFNPDTPVVLFLAHLPRRTAKDAVKAMKSRQSYVQLFIRDFCPVVGMLWPTHKAHEFMEWTKSGRLPGQPNPRSDDAVVGRWMLTTKQTIRVTVPSLVQHLDQEPSLIGKRAAWGRDRGRTALFFAEDGMAYQW